MYFFSSGPLLILYWAVLIFIGAHNSKWIFLIMTEYLIIHDFTLSILSYVGACDVQGSVQELINGLASACETVALCYVRAALCHLGEVRRNDTPHHQI